MLKQLLEAINLVREEAYSRRHEDRMWAMVSKGENTAFERPAFKIEGPEYISIGTNSSIGRNSWMACYDRLADQKFEPQLQIGSNVRIGNHSCITVIDGVSIGDGCLFSDYVYISDHSHEFSPRSSEPLVSHPLKKGGRVVIGQNVFVGMRATIMPGVSLGNHCVVGASSIVTKSFPAYSMLVGAPAKLIKSFSEEENDWIDVTGD